MKRLVLIIYCGFFAVVSNGQILEPVKWAFSHEKIKDNEYKLIFKASIDEGWHVYAQNIEEGGPIPTSFYFTPSKDYEVIGSYTQTDDGYITLILTEGAGESVYDKIFEMNLKYFSNVALFTQQIKNLTGKTITIKGYLEYMCCDEQQCLPPSEVEFNFKIEPQKKESLSEEQPVVQQPDTLPKVAKDLYDDSKSDLPINRLKEIAEKQAEQKKSNAALIVKLSETEKSLWRLLIEGFFGGLIALVTPCVFPMIPMTVSYFLKQSRTRTKGIVNAVIYGVSIILIYVSLGIGVTIIFGADTLNEMASNAFFNLLFFILLLIFAAAFLGAFELQLPSSWVNAIDDRAEKSGGVIGIFFMAFTLALVSFSCTGPIIGTLLVQAAVDKSTIAPIMGMTGFALALAIPFSFFAIFPSWLNSLPKSGGWLNSVKVVLGFLELALALKFLSNVDLAYHWGVLDREVYLVLWITIFILLGFYLLGKLRFAHDTELDYISVPRLLFAICSFSFAAYMIPGLWGAPLNAISAFPPPLATQDFVLNPGGTNSSAVTNYTKNGSKKYTDLFHCPHSIECYFDYYEAMEQAKKTGKPLFVDFTGWSCVNCRKMEASVWSDPRVLKRFNENFIIASLYVDDKTPLPDNEKYISPITNKEIKTIGNKWSDLQTSTFSKNSQPYYVILDHNGKLLADESYNMNIIQYLDFLDKGLAEFNKRLN